MTISIRPAATFPVKKVAHGLFLFYTFYNKMQTHSVIYIHQKIF